MLSAFLFSARLYFKLCIQSLGRQRKLGSLTWYGRLLRVLLYLLFIPVWLLHWLCLLLDELLFPGYKRVVIERPLFILGVPRSGTTFLHRTISEDTERFTSVSTWEVILAPSVLQKKFWLALGWLDRGIGQPGWRLLQWLQKKLFSGMEGVHEVDLAAAEEDYLLLLPMFSCFIMFLPFTESAHIWQLARFDWEASEQDKRRIMTFYRACLQKHMYVFGRSKRYLSKNAAFASWPISLHSYFPDAEFVICMREPDKTVPSLLGSIQSGADFFELDLHQGELPTMLTEMMADYYQHLLERFPTAAPVVHMNTLQRDIVATVESLYSHFGEQPAADYQQRLEELREQARTYRTRNKGVKPCGASDRSFYEHRFVHYYSREQQLEADGLIELPRPAG